MAAASAPSQFAQLLSRSKFVTYDPAISQIYTSYGGYAHRGQFGLKRPLPQPARKRRPFVTVKAIDTTACQTDWDPAHDKASWMQMWKETGAGATVDPMGSWGKKGASQTTWEMDSEFDTSKNAPAMVQGSQAAWKNIDAMTPKEFDKFLDRLRKMQPEFRRYLDEKRSRMGDAENGTKARNDSNLLPPASEPLNMADLASRPSAFHLEFLAELANKRQSNASSKQISPKPHPNAGLSYTHRNLFQEFALGRPTPGRLMSKIHKANDTRRYKEANSEATVAAFAGNLIHNPTMYTTSPDAIRLSELDVGAHTSETGRHKFRVKFAAVQDAPHVVGRARMDEKNTPGLGADVTITVSEARDPASFNMSQANTKRLGSQEYVAFRPPRVGRNAQPVVMNPNSSYFAKEKAVQPSIESLVGTLTGMISTVTKP